MAVSMIAARSPAADGGQKMNLGVLRERFSQPRSGDGGIDRDHQTGTKLTVTTQQSSCSGIETVKGINRFADRGPRNLDHIPVSSHRSHHRRDKEASHDQQLVLEQASGELVASKNVAVAMAVMLDGLGRVSQIA